MSNVVQFPNQPRVQLFLAEEYVKQEMRQHFGACVGLLHGHTTFDDLHQIAEHLKQVAGLLEAQIGIREAHR